MYVIVLSRAIRDMKTVYRVTLCSWHHCLHILREPLGYLESWAIVYFKPDLVTFVWHNHRTQQSIAIYKSTLSHRDELMISLISCIIEELHWQDWNCDGVFINDNFIALYDLDRDLRHTGHMYCLSDESVLLKEAFIQLNWMELEKTMQPRRRYLHPYGSFL